MISSPIIACCGIIIIITITIIFIITLPSSVRIQGSVVAILRGGGCSFGIKVINAQKLGAKAVVIVNTDDMKTMRLMALPDEVPLITVPCIMVSRRLQFYLEQQLRPYFPIDQHIVSMQPTGIFGEYEKRNQLALPQRLT